jgi:outer membrane lipopolysaccharide assembly protein LptE/RlpB
MITALRFLVVLLAATLCGGCAYRLGPASTMNVRSIAVPNFHNKTLEPRISVQITDAVISRFQTDGAIRVVAEEAADATLTGEITDWRREPLLFRQDNSLVAKEYMLYITAHVILTDNRTGKRLVDSDFTGRTKYFFANDMNQSERQALPLAADDLARRITDRIVDAW